MIRIIEDREQFFEIKRKHYIYFYENYGQHVENILALYKSVKPEIKTRFNYLYKEEAFFNKLTENDNNILNTVLLATPEELDGTIRILSRLADSVPDICRFTIKHFSKRSYLNVTDLRNKIQDYYKNINKDFSTVPNIAEIRCRLSKIIKIGTEKAMREGIATILEIVKKSNKRNFREDDFEGYDGTEKITDVIKIFNKGFYEILSSIFSYEKFCKSYKFKNDELMGTSWGAYELAEALGVYVCPYCNRQYITVYDGKEKGKTRCEFDHFYPKFKYPYLEVSLCNLIPSCKVCNSDLKGDKDFEYNKYLNPYEAGFEDEYVFQISEENLTVENLLNNNDRLKITIDERIKGTRYDIDIKSKIKNNIEVFSIKQLYNFHIDHVNDLIKKKLLYNNDMLEDIYIRHQKSGLFSNGDEVYRIVLGGYKNTKDFNKRPFSKLIKDISNDINFFEDEWFQNY